MAKKEVNPDWREIGFRLRISREAIPLSQDDLGGLVGVGRTAVVNWETGAQRAPVDEMRVFCRRFRLTLDWIYEGVLDGLSERRQQEFLERMAQENGGNPPSARRAAGS